ncbi:hypothetical protein BABINDRAFT_162237, partial [Babjeviella inositovora NRRL Y-12698]
TSVSDIIDSWEILSSDDDSVRSEFIGPKRPKSESKGPSPEPSLGTPEPNLELFAAESRGIDSTESSMMDSSVMGSSRMGSISTIVARDEPASDLTSEAGTDLASGVTTPSPSAPATPPIQNIIVLVLALPERYLPSLGSKNTGSFPFSFSKVMIMGLFLSMTVTMLFKTPFITSYFHDRATHGICWRSLTVHEKQEEIAPEVTFNDVYLITAKYAKRRTEVALVQCKVAKEMAKDKTYEWLKNSISTSKLVEKRVAAALQDFWSRLPAQLDDSKNFLHESWKSFDLPNFNTLAWADVQPYVKARYNQAVRQSKIDREAVNQLARKYWGEARMYLSSFGLVSKPGKFNLKSVFGCANKSGPCRKFGSWKAASWKSCRCQKSTKGSGSGSVPHPESGKPLRKVFGF